jgi:hypothetical protein
MKGIFVDTKDHMKITGLSHNRAWSDLKTITTALNKKKVTLKEYCLFMQISETDFKEGIKLKPTI